MSTNKTKSSSKEKTKKDNNKIIDLKKCPLTPTFEKDIGKIKIKINKKTLRHQFSLKTLGTFIMILDFQKD
jgi:hypothetical protein